MRSHPIPAAALASLLLAAAVPLPAAEERPLSLAEATAIALERNPDLAIDRESVRMAASVLDGAGGAYDPTLAVDGTWRDRRPPVNTVLSGAPDDELAPETRGVYGSASISQRLATGGKVTLSSSIARESTNSFFAIVTPSYSTSIGVELRQPLGENRALDPARTAIRVARVEHARSSAVLRAAMIETVAAVETAYWSLVERRRDVDVRRSSLELARSQRDVTRDRIETGLLPESELSQTTAEVERRKGELWSAREALVRAENGLKVLILGDPADPLWDATLVPTDPPEAGPASVDLEAALERAHELRPELEAVRAQRERSEIELEAARDEVRPRVDLVAGYARRGLAGDPNPDALPVFGTPVVVPGALDGGLGRSWGTIVDDDFPDASVGLEVTLPLGNHAARANASIAASRRTQSSLLLARQGQRIEREVRDAVAAVEAATARIDAARAGLAASEEQLRAEQERFAVGLSTNFLILTRQNELARAELTETAALIDYRRAGTELGRACGTLLDDRRIVLEDEGEDR